MDWVLEEEAHLHCFLSSQLTCTGSVYMLQVGPGLEIAIQDSEKALHQALGANGSTLDLKAATSNAVTKV